MARPFDDRGIYVAIKDGSFLGYRREFWEIKRAHAEKAARRYGKDMWAQLGDAKSLKDVAGIFFKMHEP